MQQHYKTFACGAFHYSAITQDGKVQYHHHDMEDTYAAMYEPIEHAVSVACGECHSAVLTSNGQVFCWGPNTYHECDVPPFPFDQKAIFVDCGDSHTVALLEDGSVVCWGDNHYHQCNHLSTQPCRYVWIACGRQHSVAVTEHGRVYCWGNNTCDQCDYNSYSSLRNVKTVSCNRADYSVAIMEDDTVVCWGTNDYGQCHSKHKSVQHVIAVQCCATHWIALLSNNTVFCCGDSSDNQCNITLYQCIQSAVSISCGVMHSAALTEDGYVHVWGGAFNGLNSSMKTEEEEEKDPYLRVIGIASGHYVILALMSDNSIRWQHPNYGPPITIMRNIRDLSLSVELLL